MLYTPEKEKNDPNIIDIVKDVWDHPVGKVGLIALGLLGSVVLAGAFFDAGAFAMHRYKNFRQAASRPNILPK